MNEWDFTQQDDDPAWIQKMLEDEEMQQAIEDQQKMALQDPEKLLELHKTKWSK